MATIRIDGLVDGSLSPFDGQYVKAYDASGPDSPGLICRLEVTSDIDDALHGESSELFELWRSVDKRAPTRLDGKPNRPLTAFTVTIT